jgi:NOL1/NOP2/sun family putative RNA methylase
MNCWENLPEKFLQKLTLLIPEEEKEQILASFCDEKPLAIRINTLKTSDTKVKQVFSENNIAIASVVWYSDAYLVLNATTRQLTDLDIYKQGHFYIQNLSSMLPALVLDPKSGEIILDLCAAPGSKTTQMATMMQNTGTIIANDRSRQRVFKLQANLKEQGVTNTKVMSNPGEILWKKYPNYFDKVLVDVPCSMEGRFLASDQETYRDWSAKKVKLLSQSQKWLLRSAVTATKPGGTIVYSTCTLSPEENEEVLEWLLKTEPYPLTIEKINIPNLSLQPALQTWNNHALSKEIENATRIFPDEIMEAFFVAKIKKSSLS